MSFWKWAYLIGLGSFFALVLVLIPLGVRDLMALFRHLQSEDRRDP